MFDPLEGTGVDFQQLILAVLVSVPATIAAVASLRAASRTKTSNGHTMGQYVESIHDNLKAHTTADELALASINQTLEKLKAGQGTSPK